MREYRERVYKVKTVCSVLVEWRGELVRLELGEGKVFPAPCHEVGVVVTSVDLITSISPVPNHSSTPATKIEYACDLVWRNPLIP